MIEGFLVNPGKEWRFIINADIGKTGTGDCGLFVEAKNEKEANKFVKNLIEIIKTEEITEE